MPFVGLTQQMLAIAQANGQDGMKPLASPATSMTRFPAWSADQSANEHAKSGSPGRPFA